MNDYEISLEIEKRRIRNEKQRLRRIEKLEALSPEFSNLRRERNALLAQAAILKISNQTNQAKEKELEAENLSIREKEILKSFGLNSDYLEVQYDCKKCNDVGFLEDGTMCDCLLNLIKAENFNRFDLNERTKEDNFSKYDLSLFSDRVIRADMTVKNLAQLNLNKAQIYCVNFSKSSPSLLLQGEPGTGKTFLVSCIVNELLKENRNIIYLSAPNLINLLYDDIRSNNSMADSNKTAFKNAELLIIDDLGTEVDNDFTRNSLNEIIDERLVSKLPTIITTNYLDLSKRYPSRMVSRLLGTYKQWPFLGEDLRIKLKKKN